MERILYLECNSGISGDMTAGALLDLGADRSVLEKALDSLQLDGYHLHFGRTKKCGIDAYDFDVHLEDHPHDAAHSHEEHHHGDHEHGDHHHGEHHHGEQEHGDHHHEGHHHGDHEHGEHHHEGHHHEGDHHHEEHHHGTHSHRNLGEIREILNRLDAKASVRELAVRMFEIVAQAESKAHGIPVEEVHFHEVGAVDSIVDIVSVAVCLDDLGISRTVISPLAEGNGYVKCQHGVMPVPVPATANIASAYGLILKRTENEGEMVTPTGAAIAAALRTEDRLPESYRIIRTGTGAGNKDFANANILRAMLIEPLEKTAEDQGDRVWKLEANLDDCTGENLGFVMEEALAAGALDVWYTPVYMKKNRPAYQVSLLCRETEVKTMEDLLFFHSTTIGVRKTPMERRVLERWIEEKETVYGTVKVKAYERGGKKVYSPEYESVQEICRKKGLPFAETMQEIRGLCR